MTASEIFHELTGHGTRAARLKEMRHEQEAVWLIEMRHEEEAAGDRDRVLGEGYSEVG